MMLDKCVLFKALSEQEWRDLTAHAQSRTFAPTTCLNIMRLFCKRIRRTDERMSEIAFFDLRARLARTLLRYPALGHEPPKISLSQEELAEMVGGTRENVNRCLREWHRRGILQLKNRWTIILNPEALHLIEEPY
jgi:CRP-like cAMP-binding protein